MVRRVEETNMGKRRTGLEKGHLVDSDYRVTGIVLLRQCVTKPHQV